MARKLILGLPVLGMSPQSNRQVEYKPWSVQFALHSFGIYCAFQSNRKLWGISDIVRVKKLIKFTAQPAKLEFK